MLFHYSFVLTIVNAVLIRYILFINFIFNDLNLYFFVNNYSTVLKLFQIYDLILNTWFLKNLINLSNL
jgi:hypothetical protein